MNPSEKTLILGLWGETALGEGTLRRLLRSGCPWTTLLDATDRSPCRLRALAMLTKPGRRALAVAATTPLEDWRASGEAVRASLKGLGASVWTLGEEGYPTLLSRCQGAPPVLGAQGLLELLEARLIAVVGTRRASALGRKICARMVRVLADAGLGVASGGALGIDAVAHRAALDHGRPTILVCGTGLDQVYPRQHHRLFETIRERGVIVSQFPPGACVSLGTFPRRNATIAGLSIATLIVEAPHHSGALYTARAAARQGRPVLVAAGPTLEPGFTGGHRWVETGSARLVHDARSLLESLGATPPPDPPTLFDAPRGSRTGCVEARAWTSIESALLGLLRERERARDELIEALGSGPEVASTLLHLELEGVVERCPGGRFRVDQTTVARKSKDAERSERTQHSSPILHPDR